MIGSRVSSGGRGTLVRIAVLDQTSVSREV